jgi:hypothetical protein
MINVRPSSLPAPRAAFKAAGSNKTEYQPPPGFEHRSAATSSRRQSPKLDVGRLQSKVIERRSHEVQEKKIFGAD